MASAPVIEIGTLPQRHPQIGDQLLRKFGPELVYRLSVNPRALPIGALVRAIEIDWVPAGLRKQAIVESREIGWQTVDWASESNITRVSRSINDQQISEEAAIVVAALLVHELEGVVIETVLQIGAGGDYLTEWTPEMDQVQIEVSGICEAGSVGQPKSRLAEKSSQVLRKCSAGFVSVTTFFHPSCNGPHSYLRFVKASS